MIQKFVQKSKINSPAWAYFQWCWKHKEESGRCYNAKEKIKACII